jgi:hypothetical protein
MGFQSQPSACLRAVSSQTPPLKPWKRSSPIKPAEPQNARSAQNPPPRPPPGSPPSSTASRSPPLQGTAGAWTKGTSPPSPAGAGTNGTSPSSPAGAGATGPPPGPPASPRTTLMGPLPPSAGRFPHLPIHCPISWPPCAPWTRRKS